MDTFGVLEENRLKEILEGIKGKRIGLIGDICLDIYWEADMTRSELSRETPHFPLPVVREWMSPGAGSNAAANIAALEPARMVLLGVIGRDWRGRELTGCLQAAGICTDNIVVSNERVTSAYAKPLRKGSSDMVYEDPRLDFGNYGPLGGDDEEKLIQLLSGTAGEIDVLCVSDQFIYGCISEGVRAAVMKLAREGLRVVIDSRDRIEHYKGPGVILKPNELEASKVVKGPGFAGVRSLAELGDTAKKLAQASECQVCMTVGPLGCIYTDGRRELHIPSHKVREPIDICGAGDTFLSAFSCALAAGAHVGEAAFIANLAAEVTIAKTGTTGTATREEILARYGQISGQT